jgi:glucans biosynthesis protein
VLHRVSSPGIDSDRTGSVSISGRLTRRNLLVSATAAGVGALCPKFGFAADAFYPDLVRQRARELAGKPYKVIDSSLPDNLKKLSYDDYRSIRFKPDQALWKPEGLPFQVQFFHRGFYYADRVDIFEVVQGQVRPILYRPDLFTFDKVPPPAPDADLGFAGFRVHAPINRPDYFDEVCVFLGASYFRAVAKGQVYGMSARGLALNAGQAKGEEFPAFKTFWLERPLANADSLVIHAVLDSTSTTGAYRFTMRPGDATTFDVEVALFPRTELAAAGLAPQSSMFFFGPNARREVDDFRPSVHDSDGLAIQNGRGEQLWRPLQNPKDLEVSLFADANTRGFGMLQREHRFEAYNDLESAFEKRPSLWTEPIGDWGEGSVELLEIPTKEEIHDNIVTFWTPKTPIAPGREHNFTYRLSWGWDNPKPAPLATVALTSDGLAQDNARLFVLDFVGNNLQKLDPQSVRGLVEAKGIEIKNIVTQPNPKTSGWRLSFEFDGKSRAELRALLLRGDQPLSETWIYRWIP